MAPLLELERASPRATGRCGAARRVAHRRRRRDRRAARRERRRQDDDAARGLGNRAPRRRRDLRRQAARTRRPRSRSRAPASRTCPEGRGIFAELTVWENLRMGAYMRRGRPDFAAVLDYFPWLDDRGATSRRARSRAASSRCSHSHAPSCTRPRLLMLDEPSLGLAPLVTREVFRVVGELNAEGGRRRARRRAERGDRARRRAARLRPRDGPRRTSPAPPTSCARTTRSATAYLGY